MSHQNVIRAWKDEEYRLSLSDAERALIPENPAGIIELADSDLDAASGGGAGPVTNTCTVTHTCCTIYTGVIYCRICRE